MMSGGLQVCSGRWLLMSLHTKSVSLLLLHTGDELKLGLSVASSSHYVLLPLTLAHTSFAHLISSYPSLSHTLSHFKIRTAHAIASICCTLCNVFIIIVHLSPFIDFSTERR